MGRTQFLHPLQHIQLANESHGYPSTRALSAVPALRLTGRDDSTRVQLQRQRLRDQHATAIVSKNIPGFKTSAGMSMRDPRGPRC